MVYGQPDGVVRDIIRMKMHVGPCERPAPVGAPPVVLIVEDQVLVRLVAVEMVEEAGFRTIEAAHAQEALKLLDQRQDIALIFSDIDMPGPMNGYDLAHEVTRRWPPIGIVLTSGVTPRDSSQVPPNGVFLNKPYLADDLEAALKRLMH